MLPAVKARRYAPPPRCGATALTPALRPLVQGGRIAPSRWSRRVSLPLEQLRRSRDTAASGSRMLQEEVDDQHIAAVVNE